MALSDSDIETIISLWKYSEQQADPRSKEENIVSGLRARPLIACQYWIKGLGTICSYWDGTKCLYNIKPNDFPSGYNDGKCDFIGRRDTCDKYDGVIDTENYVCIAPNIFLSGLGKVAGETSTGYLYAPIPIDEIKGYCKGKCDGQGRGTGCGGIPGVSPIVCNYYRPWQMGFGSIEPKQLERTVDKNGNIHITKEAYKKALGEVFDPAKKRLPFAFEVYNLRGQFQKCAYWNNDFGSFFKIEGADYIYSDEDLELLCSCPHINAEPYHTLVNPTGGGSQEWLLQDVWSQANTVICNGAKPECPCYTGEWVCCDDLHMVTGMRITANQIFELRFWAALWGSQKEYDKFYESKPNWQDTPTASIYTFKKWQQIGITASDSIMEGRISSMCMPVPLNNRRFIPENYITDKPIIYGASGIDKGTTSPESGQIYFPSLIRHPDITSDIQYLDIIYPYSNDSPWNVDICGATDEDPLCIKKGSLIDGDTISVIGSTIRNKKVYAFNLNMLSNSMPEFYEHWNVGTISNVKEGDCKGDFNNWGLSQRKIFFLHLESFIIDLYRTDSKNICYSISNKDGYFKVGPLNLKYQEKNRIVICVEIEDGVWDFRVRPVQNKWYGGFLIQSSFKYEGDGKYLPVKFMPAANITGNVYSYPNNPQKGEKCSLSSIIHSFNIKYTNNLFEKHSIYTYCYRKVTDEKTSDTWTRIGNSGYIWAELSDSNLNGIFEWGINVANMVPELATEKVDGEGVVQDIECYTSYSKIEMEEVKIEVFVSGERSIPPSACVLKPKDDKHIIFFNDEWYLEIEYWYKELSNSNKEGDNVEIIFPDFSSDFVHFNESNLTIKVSREEFAIEGVQNQTVALTGIFKDESGRVVSVMPTKMLVQINKIECRNEEIFYRYQGPSKEFKMLPDTGGGNFRVNGKVQPAADGPDHRYTPKCGDHENGMFGTKNGPVWFPYDSCDTCDFYSAWGNAAYCTAWFRCGGEYGSYSDSGADSSESNGSFAGGGGGEFGGAGATGSWDEDEVESSSVARLLRYCGPPLHNAWAIPHASLAFCHLGFHYRYSTMAGALFTGYANMVHWVDVAMYKTYHWTLPPFNNRGREMTIKYLSQDYHYHTTYKTSPPGSASDWVPLVPTMDDFQIPIGYFDETSFLANEGFMHSSQLNFVLSTLINEKKDCNRKRFEDVFGLRGIWRASYPSVVARGMIVYAPHYYFKEADTAWAWQEYWKPIEYFTKKLSFVNYERPKYIYDHNTQEYRFICEENAYIMSYTAPQFDDDGNLKKHPSIKLNDGPERYFEIRYEDYDSISACVWMDEGNGDIDGSVEDVNGTGDEGTNIYEKTSPNTPGSNWIHDENCLFDSEAVKTYEEAEAMDRMIKVSDELDLTKKYWNRGIIANIDINSLKYLPYEEGAEKILGAEYVPPSIEGSGWWYNTSFYTHTIIISPAECLSKIIITGKWGRVPSGTSKYDVCIPGVSITSELTTDIGPITIAFKKPIEYEKRIHGNSSKIYKLEFNLPVTVDRMLNYEYLIIYFTGVFEQFVVIESTEGVYCKYIDVEEKISVYERLYIESKGSNFGDWNINGPKVKHDLTGENNFVLQGDLDGYNSGTYYAVSPQLYYVPSTSFETRDKMRSGYAGEQYFDKEKLDINIGNISTIEQEQQNVYENAYNKDVDGDTLIYEVTTIPKLETFFNKYDIDLNFFGTLVMNTKKTSWSNHYLSDQYEQGSVWYPGGHYWRWSENIEQATCWTIIPEYGQSPWYPGQPDFVFKRYNLQDMLYVHVDKDQTEPTDNIVVALFGNRLGFKLESALKAGLLDGMDVGWLSGTATETFVDPVGIP